MLQSPEANVLALDFPLLDEEGFLFDASSWTPEFTRQRALLSSVELTEQHWVLIHLVRNKYLRLGALPRLRRVCKAAGFEPGELKRQFGSCLALWKIAGLPNPGEEAKAYMN